MIRALLDKQFETSISFYQKLLIVYIVTFVLPLAVYFAKVRSKSEIESRICIFWSMLGGCLLTLYQLFKWKSMKGVYFSHINNYVEDLGILIYWGLVSCFFFLEDRNDIEIYFEIACIWVMLINLLDLLRIYEGVA